LNVEVFNAERLNVEYGGMSNVELGELQRSVTAQASERGGPCRAARL
jgi:hypothetical protein